MGTLVASALFDDFYQYLDSFRIESLYQDSKQIEADLSGKFTYNKISTTQMVGSSSGDIVVVDGTGLSIPVGALLNGTVSGLSWNNVGGTLTELQVYQGGSFQGSSVTGGNLLLDAALSSTGYAVTYGGNELIFTGSGFPTDVKSFGALVQGDYSGANFNISSLTLKSGGKSISLSLSASAYTLTAGDYKAVFSGTGLPTSFSPVFVEDLVKGEVGLTIGGSVTGITVTQISTGSTVLSESAVTPISLDTLLSGKQQFFTSLLSNANAVQAPAADIADVFSRLNTLAAAGTVTSIKLTDSGTPTLTLSGQEVHDTAALAKISGAYNLVVSGVGAYDVSAALALTHLTSLSIADYAGDLIQSYTAGAIEQALSSGKVTSITLLDSGVPDFYLQPSQLTSDAAILKAVSGNFTVTQYGGSGGTIEGYAGHGNIVNVTYGAITVTPVGDGVSFKLATAFGTANVSDVNAIQTSSALDFVAATPGPASAVTTGNVTELYSAVLGREPDVAGLAFYQNFLKTNPTTSLQQFAEFFLASTEYSSNSAHAYAKTSAGNAQFITDSYQNLLHRTPSAAEVSFYQTNVMTPALANLTPGTTAYGAAQTEAHAQMLVYFSASPEFLTDVQITAAHPADAQHWLYLI